MRKIIEAVEQAQTANPRDNVSMDIPLLVRVLEFAMTDAKTEQDLHSLADNMINLSPDGNTLTMYDYEELVMGLAGDENAEGQDAHDEYMQGDSAAYQHGEDGGPV